MQDGVRSLVHRGRHVIQGSNVRAFLEAEPQPLVVSLRHLPDEIQHDMELFQAATDQLDISWGDRVICKQSLHVLARIYSSLALSESKDWVRRRLSAAPTHFPRDLVKLLERRDPPAMAIVARFFALMKFIDDI